MKKSNTTIICLSPNSGGMEMDAIKLAKKLSPYTQVVLIAKENSFIANARDSYVGHNNILLETISFRSMLSFSIIFHVRKIIKMYNIKNVIFFGASELKSLYFSFLGLNINLIIRHGTTKTKSKKDWFHRLIYNNVDYHIAISKHIRENVLHIIPFGKKTKDYIIYPSIDNILSKQNTNISKDIKLLHTGRITQGKGQIDAIMACKILVENNIDFCFNIVGGYENNKEEKDFLNFYNSISYKKNINIVGFTDNVVAFLESSDIFIFPSHGEGFGNSFAEALAYGLVCISYDNTTFKEFKELGFYMHIVENKNLVELEKTLLYITENLVQEKIKTYKNRELIKNIFDEKSEIKKYLDILK